MFNLYLKKINRRIIGQATVKLSDVLSFNSQCSTQWLPLFDDEFNFAGRICVKFEFADEFHENNDSTYEFHKDIPLPEEHSVMLQGGHRGSANSVKLTHKLLFSRSISFRFFSSCVSALTPVDLFTMTISPVHCHLPRLSVMLRKYPSRIDFDEFKSTDPMSNFKVF